MREPISFLFAAIPFRPAAVVTLYLVDYCDHTNGVQADGCHVRFGSKADIGARMDHVRFTPKSGRSAVRFQLTVVETDLNEDAQRVIGMKG
jgi:hypothetical protein